MDYTDCGAATATIAWKNVELSRWTASIRRVPGNANGTDVLTPVVLHAVEGRSGMDEITFALGSTGSTGYDLVATGSFSDVEGGTTVLDSAWTRDDNGVPCSP